MPDIGFLPVKLILSSLSAMKTAEDGPIFGSDCKPFTPRFLYGANTSSSSSSIVHAARLYAQTLRCQSNVLWRLVRSPGFEPGSSTWQADVLDQTRLRPQDSNEESCRPTIKLDGAAGRDFPKREALSVLNRRQPGLRAGPFSRALSIAQDHVRLSYRSTHLFRMLGGSHGTFRIISGRIL